MTQSKKKRGKNKCLMTTICFHILILIVIPLLFKIISSIAYIKKKKTKFRYPHENIDIIKDEEIRE